MTPFIFSNCVLDDITPIQFNDILLIPIKLNITKLFGTNKIKFQISIKDKKIVIESPMILTSLHIQERCTEQETIDVS